MCSLTISVTGSPTRSCWLWPSWPYPLPDALQVGYPLGAAVAWPWKYAERLLRSWARAGSGFGKTAGMRLG